MNAQQIIRAVESIGGVLFAEGEKLRLKAPVEISPELKQAIRHYKEEILDVLCPHAQGCHHSKDDLIREYRRTGKLRIEYDGNAVWLVRNEEMAANIKVATVYTISEWQRIAELSHSEIRMLHQLRTIGGPGGRLG